MSGFATLQQTTLNKIRTKTTVSDYHKAFGLLFDILTDLLGLAKQPNSNEAEGSEMGKLLFAAISAMSQHCAEDMRLCIPQEEQINDDRLPKFMCQIIIDLLAEIENNQFVINNPQQKNSTINVTTVDPRTIEATKDFLYEHNEDLFSPSRTQPL